MWPDGVMPNAPLFIGSGQKGMDHCCSNSQCMPDEFVAIAQQQYPTRNCCVGVSPKDWRLFVGAIPVSGRPVAWCNHAQSMDHRGSGGPASDRHWSNSQCSLQPEFSALGCPQRIGDYLGMQFLIPWPGGVMPNAPLLVRSGA